MTGGRYDKLLVQFGKDTPAVGFAIVVDRLMQVLSRQRIVTEINRAETVVLYERDARAAAIGLAGHFRKRGQALQLIRRSSEQSVTDYVSYARRQGMKQLFYLTGDKEPVSEYQVSDGRMQTLSLEEVLSFAGLPADGSGLPDENGRKGME